MRAIRPFLVAMTLALAAACGGRPSTPQDTVALYLKRMGRDPMRVLPMLTDDFHRAHRMVFANTAELPSGIVLKPETEAMPDEPDYAVERGRLGWLMAPSLIDRVWWLLPKLPNLQLGWAGSEEQGNRARVKLQAWLPGEAPVGFVFALRRRDASAPWRIDRTKMLPGPSVDARFACFMVAPDLDCVSFIRREAPRREAEEAKRQQHGPS